MKKSTKILLIILLCLLLALLLYFILRPSPSRSKAAEPVKEKIGNMAEQEDGPLNPVWLELPASSANDDALVLTHTAMMEGEVQRNYTIHYDEDMYAALWVAYPLCESHTSSGREETWGYDPHVPQQAQTSVRTGYGASVPTKNYPKNFYARGHQIPNADRSAVPEMQAQTYYSTNMTPQLQNGFNGSIWAKLEEAVRKEIPEGDTLYVVTGAAFQKRGSEDFVKEIVNKNDSKTLPVPNYYWKAVLKVERSGDSVIDACAIGFWLPHDDLKGASYADFSVPVDRIEEWTGFDLFPALSDPLEGVAESNDDWSRFQSFR